MTSEDANKSTKQKILEVANDLFAKNGYAGTSVRDIATAADVNLAAINYHFKNKDSLYLQVFEFNYDLINTAVTKIGEKATSTEDLAIEVYRLFISRESAILNTFRTFLTDNVTIPTDDSVDRTQGEFGPPGAQTFLQHVDNDLGGGHSEREKQWVVKMIFSIVVHHGVIMSTAVMKEKCKTNKEFTPEALEDAVRHAVRAFLFYLKSKQLKM